MDKKIENFPSRFEELNLSNLTIQILNKLGFIHMTKIQRICIPPALKGRDILGSARTGSGKTLCFVVPIVEKLWSKEWTDIDQIGGCIICPIRELGLQIFDLTRTISSVHCLTSQMLMGGRLSKIKKKRNPFSILITTPGSLVKEAFSVKEFCLDQLQILSVDEIDKILDMGFQKIFFSVLKIIPRKIQTLAFSATLTEKVRNLTHLNLNNPVFCCTSKLGKEKSFKENHKFFPVTVKKTVHFYTKIHSKEKHNILFSFINSHKDEKIIVFFSTRKQINFFSEILKKFSPCIFLFCISGNMNQRKRVENVLSFNESTKGVMLSTDLISRGMDFKFVDWIVQADCPHDVETYLHRAGRTGRFFEKGKIFLIIVFGESFFLKMLAKCSIELFRLKISKEQVTLIDSKIYNFIRQNPKFGLLCRSAFFSYFQSLNSQKNKKIFGLNKRDIEEKAKSFGLRQKIGF